MLRTIGIIAIVLTLLMFLYTMTKAYNQTNYQGSSSTQSQPQAAADQSSAQPQAAQVDAKLFPQQLAGMSLTNAISGPDAIKEVSQLHGSNIEVKTAYVVAYQGSGGLSMNIWFSEAKDEKDAKGLFVAMDSKMPTTQAFQNYKTVTVDGKQFKFVTGMGQEHYYWQTGNRVIWVSIGGKNTAEVLKQVAPLY